MNIAIALNHLRPGEVWTLDGEEYSGLTWISDTNKPTKKELEEAWPKIEAELVARQEAEQSSRAAAIAHAKSLGFTDAMIAVMYPNLTTGA